MNMQITYTLKDFQMKETSKGRAIMTYHLVDKDGNNRIVSAIAKLGFRNKIASIHPLHHREMPLLDILKKTSINETLEVDFTAYNKANPRASGQNQKMSVKNTSVSYQERKHLIKDKDSLLENKFRILQLVGLAVIVLTAIFSVMDGFFK